MTRFMVWTGGALCVSAFLYLWVASVTFQFRNPTANQTVLLTHFPDVLAFNKLDEFQPKETK